MSSMGMDKNGTQVLTPNNVWIKVATFTVRSGYPATVITSDSLQLNTGGTGTLRYNVTFGLAAGQQMRVMRGATILDGPVSAGSVRTSGSISVTAGDLIELWANAQGSGFSQVASGAANTFLEFNQTTSIVNVDGVHTTTWGRTGSLVVQENTAGSHTTTWGRTGSLSVTEQVTGSHTTTWGRTGDIYKGAFYNVAGSHTTSWGFTGSIIDIPKPTPPPQVIQFDNVAFSIHTVDGRMVGDIPCEAVTGFQWGREMNEVSTGNMSVTTEGAAEVLAEIRPWVHWLTIWHDNEAVWTGPIQSARLRRSTSSITVRDPSTFMWRTRVPITRTWRETSPADISELLWVRMLELHRIRTRPLVLPSVAQETFTLTAQGDQRMLFQFMDDLVKVGLRWTVVAGRPVLGNFPTDPVAELQECDFMVEIDRLRDGTQTFNDIRVQGQNYVQTVKAPLADLNLQNIVSLDDVFGVSNITKAAKQYVRDQAQIYDTLFVPGGATLHPEAPVTLNDLVPGKYFLVHAQDISQLMRLDAMNVSGSPSSFDVQVTLVAENPVSELGTTATGGTL